MSTPTPQPPLAQAADRPPLPSDIADQAEFETLVGSSLEAVRAAADKWRSGLAALVGLVTGGLLIKGPSAASDLTTGWRAAVTILAAGGIGVAIAGLWFALKAAAGVPRRLNYQQIIDEYITVTAFKAVHADQVASTLKQARRSLMLALPVLGAAVIVWWWAPTKPASPAAFLEVELASPTAPICGTLDSGDNGHLRLKVSGEENPRVIPLSSIKNIRVRATC